jgi:hypothetical protein
MPQVLMCKLTSPKPAPKISGQNFTIFRLNFSSQENPLQAHFNTKIRESIFFVTFQIVIFSPETESINHRQKRPACDQNLF